MLEGERARARARATRPAPSASPKRPPAPEPGRAPAAAAPVRGPRAARTPARGRPPRRAARRRRSGNGSTRSPAARAAAASGPSGHASAQLAPPGRPRTAPAAAPRLRRRPSSWRTGPRAGGYPRPRRVNRAERRAWTAGSAPHTLRAVPRPLHSVPGHPRVALVHDFLLDLRGAERVFLELCGCGPTPTSSPPSTTSAGPRAGSPGAACTARSCSGCGRPRARSGRCCRCIRPRSSRSTCRATTSSSRAPRRGRTPCSCDEDTVARQLLPQPVPLRLERPRADAGAAATRVTRAFLRGAFRRWRQWDWIAAQRTDRYVANSRITQARIRAYFGREADDRAPAGRHLALRARAGRRPLRGGLGADAPQADRRGGRRRSTSSGCRWSSSATGPPPGGLQRQAGPTVKFAGRGCPTPSWPRSCSAARALVVTSVEEFGIAAVESPGRRPAGDRAARGRRAGDRRSTA